MNKQEEVTLEMVNKQIAELKKKMLLSENQKKAYYEEWDSEKKQNADCIKNLKEEIKDLYSKLSEKYMTKPRGKICSQKEITLIINKGNQEALEMLDLKVIDLQKRLDLLRHETQQKQLKVQELGSKRSDKCKSRKKVFKKFSFDPKKVVNVENRTHLVELNIMEADHLHKKYRAIRNQLLDERVTFESALNNIENNIINQEVEITNLQKACDEAKSLKTVADISLSKAEQKSSEGQELRKIELNELRLQVEDHRSELERLERQMIPVKTISSSLRRSESYPTDADIDYPPDMIKIAQYLDNVFSSLKAATGVIDNEDVLRRFLFLKETKSILESLKEASENQKQELVKRKDELTIKLEQCKFTEVKNTQQNKEDITSIKSLIEKEAEEFDEIRDAKHRTQKQIQDIMNKIHLFCFKLKDVDNAKVPEKCPPPAKCEWLICLLRTKLESALRRSKEDNFVANVAKNEEKLKVFNVWSQLPTSLETKTSDMDEEEEIPTRNSLKRDAQLIFETGSRRRGYRIHTIKHTQF